MDRRTFAIAGAATLAVAPAAKAAAMEARRRPAARQPVRHLVALLHGYGGNGEDLMGLAPSLEPYVPNAAFVAPDGPVELGGGAFAWYESRGGAGPDQAARGAMRTATTLNPFLDAELARHGLGPDKLILVGFSQGATLSLNLGLRRAVMPAAIVAFAGTGIGREGLSSVAPDKPPILLIEGADDPVGRGNAQAKAVKLLEGLGAKPQAHIVPGLGHWINAREIVLAGELLRSVTRA